MNARESVLTLARKEAARIARGNDATGEPWPKKRKASHVDQDEAAVDGSGSQLMRTRSQRVNTNKTPSLEPEIIEDSQDEEYVSGLSHCTRWTSGMSNLLQRTDVSNVLLVAARCRRKQSTAISTPVSRAKLLHRSEQHSGKLDQIRGASVSSLIACYDRSLQKPRSNQDSPSKGLERLPAINYSLMKDGMLRKKFRELGIPDSGQRPVLQRRHTEWVNLWNANCDAKYPKSKRELLHELDIWERTQGGSAGQSSFASNNANTVMRKDFDASKWSEEHDSDFKRLIANARKRSDAQVRSTIPGASAAPERNPAPETTPVPATYPVPEMNPPQLPAAFVGDPRENGVPFVNDSEPGHDRERHQPVG